MKTVVYPGTFDPVTLGHSDLIERASRLFDRVVVAVAASPGKKPLFDLATRISLIEQVMANNPKIKVVGFSCLLTELMQQQESTIILRGVRGVADFEYELQLAQLNKAMSPNLESIFLPPSERLSFIASTLVREVASLGGDVSKLVHPCVEKALKNHYAS
ncbi:pantetheine-phosphate adenylyltransferase [Marinospirillum insulare]|uniref:Phosphopantetheine adenylyltransferase n=1 Tax=Marinospirillum insulare TaxID=217169 RepID=A0ABQ6A081_9GAMM|nr:pantetheine-phosphate adenylyltransferase [Marinospirillum insulare]GLR65201.1 phosphopantetheine adenylyltransferase [Marinospirillum insulare]